MLLELGTYWLSSALSLLFALLLDRWLGEPNRFHPLVGFGWLANQVERRIRSLTADPSSSALKFQGGIAWLLAVVPITATVVTLTVVASQISMLLLFLLNTFVLYLTIGGRSLVEHAERIYQPLVMGDIEQARFAVSMIVSRNTEQMGEYDIASAAIESVLENGNDAVFAPLFWFALLGAPGAVALRLSNTLDAMWGYKNQRYRDFGFVSAKLDDVLGYVPARITALVYTLQGQSRAALHCWRTQAKSCASPNGGVVMTAGAGALGITIGGPTYYDGVLHDKKPMGVGKLAQAEAIKKANALVTSGSFGLAIVWLLVCIGCYTLITS